MDTSFGGERESFFWQMDSICPSRLLKSGYQEKGEENDGERQDTQSIGYL